MSGDPAARIDMARVRADLAELVSYPSIHLDPDRRDACRASAEWVAKAFAAEGIPTEIHETVDGSFAVTGHRPGPDGAPTVLLYSHHDVQPAGPIEQWGSDPFILTERDGRPGQPTRWYGRGSADCKGNLVAHLAALRAVDLDAVPFGLRIVIEGSEEAGGEGLDHLVQTRPDLFAADIILIGDTGNVAAGVPTLTTSLRGVANLKVSVETLDAEVHSGQFGGAAADALAALIAGLASLRGPDGETTIDGLTADQSWSGATYSVDQFRADSTTRDGVDVLGVPADRVWAQPAATVIGIDAPPTAQAANAIVPRASAMLNLRVPPGQDADEAQRLLAAHLRAHIPWHAQVIIEPGAIGKPFSANTSGPGYRALTAALEAAYDAPVVHSGQGGSIPLCTVLQETFPAAEIALLGVEEPLCRIHAVDESVDPAEIHRIALAEARFLTNGLLEERPV
ncbi:M20/M25/M40 family metallo-hydrolase [Jongsikchunia kroppenstedtii]|uniref:M20/M25/M40 family metallo-hydrolase n=1 Tax=Jongsikchunia kroppenstedtii TaxID=1121721 RepID=UPI00036B05BA|nr:M20/M25/M40 family metallo-hydrolase [Jongsikchunia kroppenstedtii]